jgi:hypothetical protein
MFSSFHILFYLLNAEFQERSAEGNIWIPGQCESKRKTSFFWDLTPSKVKPVGEPGYLVAS